MRRIILLAIVGGLVGLLRPQVASAQFTKPIYAVKFVCGTQAPITSTPPAEPPVKPGNYATKINVETLTPAVVGSTYSWNVSIQGHGASGSQFVTLSQFRTEDITCVDIVARVSALFPTGAPEFINGYVNIFPNTGPFPNTGAALAVTGVYTSQGCTFGQSGDSQGAPICAGPVSIEVVPETALAFTPLA